MSPEQQKVVEHRGSPLQVIACAGSGKTESISRRVAALINEGNPPESIVAFTFTEKAASELKERIYKRVEEVKGRDLIIWAGHPKFEPGMFVAKIPGDAMEPGIPAVAYCLFKKTRDESPKGQTLLISHPAIDDPHTGRWAVRKVTYTGSIGDNSDWKHGQLKLEAANSYIPSKTIDVSGESDFKIFGQFVGIVD